MAQRECCLVFATGRCGTVYLSYLLRVLGMDGRLILHEESVSPGLRHLLGSWGVVAASRYSSLHYYKGLADLWDDKDVNLKFVVLTRELFPTVLSWLRHYAKREERGKTQVARWAAAGSLITFNPKWTLCQMFFWHWFSTYATAFGLHPKGDGWRFFKFADLNSVEKLNKLMGWMGGFAPADATVLQRVRDTAQYKGKKPLAQPNFAAELRAWLATLSKVDKALVVATGHWLAEHGAISRHPKILLEG